MTSIIENKFYVENLFRRSSRHLTFTLFTCLRKFVQYMSDLAPEEAEEVLAERIVDTMEGTEPGRTLHWNSDCQGFGKPWGFE